MLRRVPQLPHEPAKDPRNKDRQAVSLICHTDPRGKLETGDGYRAKHQQPMVLAAAIGEWLEAKEVEERKCDSEASLPPATDGEVPAADGGSCC